MNEPAAGDLFVFAIGSDLSCDLVLADETVAPQHAVLEVRSHCDLTLADCGQQPTTVVVQHGQPRPIARAPLASHDRVRFGDIELSVPELVAALDLARKIPGWHGQAAAPEAESITRPGATAATSTSATQAATHKPAATRNAPILLPCARCGRSTDSLKRHRLHRWVVFIGIAWWAQTADYTACPACMRALLIERTLVNLPGANVAWPLILIVNAFHYANTFRHGHSTRVKELML